MADIAATRLVIKGLGGPVYLEMHVEKILRVKFLKEQIYETEGRMQGPKYQRDQVVELPEGQAMRWINREVAFETDEKVSAADYLAPPEEEQEEDEEEQLTRARAPKATTSKNIITKRK